MKSNSLLAAYSITSCEGYFTIFNKLKRPLNFSSIWSYLYFSVNSSKLSLSLSLMNAKYYLLMSLLGMRMSVMICSMTFWESLA